MLHTSYTVNLPELGELVHEECLLYYDGPLISVFRDKNKVAVILYAAERSAERRAESWLAFACYDNVLEDWRMDRISNRDFILWHRMGLLYLAEQTYDDGNWTVIDISDDPGKYEQYVPDQGVYCNKG